MLIDTHIHHEFGTTNTATFVQRAERGLTDHFWVSTLKGGYYPSPADIRLSNDAVHVLMQRLPAHVVGFCYVNPVHGSLAVDELRQRVEQQGFRGVKLWVATYADDPRVDSIVEAAAAYGIPLLVHCWVKVGGQSVSGGNLPFESTPMHLGRLARRHPKARFIMAHLGGDWEYGVRVARDCPNISVDTSGSLAERDSIESLVDAVGIERVLFGTDNSDLDFCLGKIVGADLTDDQREAILWRNAARLLDLSSSTR
ncbi:MAG: amidohydrolase [Chloroflexi bacterium]|nr:amidohydrolase [Chloroflexota bacterium]